MRHQIRLREPWRLQADAPGAGLRLVRKFNWPRAARPAAKDRVELVIEGARTGLGVWLNGALLGEVSPDSPAVRLAVSRLALHNELAMEFRPPVEQPSAAMIGEVRLEIQDEDL